MAVRVISAPPGHGKTLNMTRIAIEKFRELNPIKKRIKENYIFINQIYANYPILLHKKKKPFKYIDGSQREKEAIPIKLYYDENLDEKYYSMCSIEEMEYYGVFCNKVRFTDMRLKYRFSKYACFFIDEIQYLYDSMDYKDFPDCLAHFFQVHRHMNYDMIYTNSQSLSRIIKRVLVISEEYWNVINLRNIFFWTIADFKITYDVSSSKENENKEDFKADYFRKIFLHRKVFDGYFNKYLGSLNEGLPYYDIGQFSSLKMSREDILKGFMISNSEKEELKNQLF